MGECFYFLLLYRFQCLFYFVEKLVDVIKRSVLSEDVDDENLVVFVYFSEFFVKVQLNMIKLVSKYICKNFLDIKMGCKFWFFLILFLKFKFIIVKDKIQNLNYGFFWILCLVKYIIKQILK